MLPPPPPPIRAASRRFPVGIDEELHKYISFLIKEKVEAAKVTGKIGSIVMNCNPFTFGHLHLIEYAAQNTDFLYVFIVQEDKSFFPFSDRIELVKKGTSHLKNIKILPSGKFIISMLTFPDYFLKKDNFPENKSIDLSNDIALFAEKIAPVLGINIRFVGSEPYCALTRQYNFALKDMLPKYGIEYCQIDRKTDGDNPISASSVRRALEEKNYDCLRKLVPACTFNYLSKKDF